MMLRFNTTIFATAAAAEAFAASVIDEDAGEYFAIHTNPNGDGRCTVKIFEADGYEIADA